MYRYILVLITFTAAAASYYLMERPLLQYGKALSRRVRATPRQARPELAPSSIMEQ